VAWNFENPLVLYTGLAVTGFGFEQMQMKG